MSLITYSSAPDLTPILTAIAALDAKIDIIDGIVDTINTKVPQMVRGHFTTFGRSTTMATLQDICNITGSGKLVYFNIYFRLKKQM